MKPLRMYGMRFMIDVGEIYLKTRKTVCSFEAKVTPWQASGICQSATKHLIDTITPQQTAQTETVQAGRRFLYTELSRQPQPLTEPHATIHVIVPNVYHVHAMWRQSEHVLHNGKATSKIIFVRNDESELGQSGRS